MRSRARAAQHQGWRYSRWCNGPEAFLASCVPDLEFHLLSIDLNCPDFKIHSNGGNVAAWRESVGEWEPKSCLFWMSQSTLLEHDLAAALRLDRRTRFPISAYCLKCLISCWSTYFCLYVTASLPSHKTTSPMPHLKLKAQCYKIKLLFFYPIDWVCTQISQEIDSNYESISLVKILR